MTKVTKGQKVGAAAGAATKGVGKTIGAVAKGVTDVAKGAAGGVQKTLKTINKVNPNDATDTKAPDPNAATDTKAPDPNAAGTDNNLQIKGGKKKIVPPSEQNKQVVNQSIDWSKATFIFENDAAVSLSGGQLDNIFMAAVRQAIARDEGGQTDTGTGVAPANAQQGGIKGAAQGAAGQFADAGSTLPPEIKKQLETLPARDRQQLLKML